MTVAARRPGHVLAWSGAPHDDDGVVRPRLPYVGVGGPGRGKCTCGVLSEPLPSAYARRKWHQQHKGDAARPSCACGLADVVERVREVSAYYRSCSGPMRPGGEQTRLERLFDQIADDIDKALGDS